MGLPIIQIQNLSKSFGSIDALKGISMNVDKGIFGLIGPNGAGKTTLFRILLNLITPNTGSARIFGLDIVKDSLQIRKRVGVLHERPIYLPSLTPLEYLSQVSKIYDKQRDPHELLEMVGLENAKKRPIGHLSAGMRQRLGIAQSLMGCPELILLDEPTSNLDVSGKSQVLDLIIRIHEELGTSFLISSHVLSELQKICTGLAFLGNGKLLEQGNIAEIMERYSKDRIRIITSDASKLADILRDVSWAENVRVTGISTVIVTSSLDLESVRSSVIDISNHQSIDVFNVGMATDLVDIYTEVFGDEGTSL